MLNIRTICDSIRFSTEEEHFELVSAMSFRGGELKKNNIDHDMCTITFNQAVDFCNNILPINCECGQLTVETKLLCNYNFK